MKQYTISAVVPAGEWVIVNPDEIHTQEAG